AAMTTTILHERCNPSLVINTGSAGGFSSKLEVGDIVISTHVVHHDVEATAFDYRYGQVQQMPAQFTADARLVELAKDTAQTSAVQAAEGLIETGDSFMENPERVAFVKKQFPSMIAAEMEAAAIAQVCYQYATPFVVIRALSDIA